MKYFLLVFMAGCSSLAPSLKGDIIKDDFGKCHLVTEKEMIFDYPCTENAKIINHRSKL